MATKRNMDDELHRADAILAQMGALPIPAYLQCVRDFIAYLAPHWPTLDTIPLVERTLRALDVAGAGDDVRGEAGNLLESWAAVAGANQDNMAGVEIACHAAATDLAGTGDTRYAAEGLSTVAFSHEHDSDPVMRDLGTYFLSQLSRNRDSPGSEDLR